MVSIEKHFIINPNDNYKKSVFHIKKILQNSESKLKIISGVKGSGIASGVVDFLSRLNYVSIKNITTETRIINNQRKTTLTISIEKTDNFDIAMKVSEQKRKEHHTEKELKKIFNETIN